MGCFINPVAPYPEANYPVPLMDLGDSHLPIGKSSGKMAVVYETIPGPEEEHRLVREIASDLERSVIHGYYLTRLTLAVRPISAVDPGDTYGMILRLRTSNFLDHIYSPEGILARRNGPIAMKIGTILLVNRATALGSRLQSG